jgi:uncharacterized membrane protein YoaT (DUF817 family)
MDRSNTPTIFDLAKQIIFQRRFDLLYQFTWIQIRNCLFPFVFVLLMAFGQFITTFGLFYYDFLFIGAIFIQFIFFLLKIETKREILFISLFHIIGFVLETYKTLPFVGSWSYPLPSYIKIGAVPLFSGFMYASVASYIVAAWKNFDIKIVNQPSIWTNIGISGLIYLNFFTNRFIHDMRYFIFILIALIYMKVDLYFKLKKDTYRTTPFTSFFLIAFFIYLAENIATFLKAWEYPGQKNFWQIVHPEKITSWSLLIIISFLIIMELNPKGRNLLK